MKRVLLFTALAVSGLVSYSQQVKGKIFDATNNNALYGATISLAGKTVSTAADGTFSIDCNKSSEISVSFVGYETYRQKI
ncbi:MAG TPA: carboxypeptidase-like regulatory domain-containing protein, partial [Chitinophagaceae bacterium]|nr:carboxypeptidase-like regulatory domain-containing protein [Chitinophagaceae bacterium]